MSEDATSNTTRLCAEAAEGIERDLIAVSAANPSWMLAAVLNGWAESTRLDAYQAERQPITDQVSRFAFEMAREVSQQPREISADIERQDAIGEATRATIGNEAYDLYIQQQCCAGLNFGYFYGNSPIITGHCAATAG